MTNDFRQEGKTFYSDDLLNSFLEASQKMYLLAPSPQGIRRNSLNNRALFLIYYKPHPPDEPFHICQPQSFSPAKVKK